MIDILLEMLFNQGIVNGPVNRAFSKVSDVAVARYIDELHLRCRCPYFKCCPGVCTLADISPALHTVRSFACFVPFAAPRSDIGTSLRTRQGSVRRQRTAQTPGQTSQLSQPSFNSSQRSESDSGSPVHQLETEVRCSGRG